MQLRYLRHYYDVVYDYWIAAVKNSAVRIFAAIEYSITPVVLGCGHQKILEGILGGCSHGKTTSVSLVRIRFDAIFCSYSMDYLFKSSNSGRIRLFAIVVFVRITKIWS